MANSSTLKMEAIYSSEVHGVTSHKTIFFIAYVARTKGLVIRVTITAKDGGKYVIKGNKCQKIDNIRLTKEALLDNSYRIFAISIPDER
jgi:hypothetical protein